jgi:hypothetical protein
MIKGECLCGAVRFELKQTSGPFELCHCNRCRKATGSAFAAGIGVRTKDFRLIAGREFINRYEAPILDSPPAYTISFCRVCGSPVPDPDQSSEWFEVAAGLLDDDPEMTPDRHIFVELKAVWYKIADSLPQLNKQALTRFRTSKAEDQAGNI